ncbi:hypothetical protein Bcep1808_7008 (plasmid) [Burkholderia vietnamiensis G4]|uniref:Uncharacterized protein n=1 Tax=Burkholderia vietnamiensis (strain G4 / LMG 22486) TaxID=269482 RepID=A4JUE1_BURVG|nr:hypothetical protein Bcep1808_7008 [Burkholderia vietnamiensis G4]
MLPVRHHPPQVQFIQENAMSNMNDAVPAQSGKDQAVDRDALTRAGFRMHCGGRFDGALCGRWWWTLCQPGWSGVETAALDFKSEDEAWADAAKHLENDPELSQ